MGECDRLGNCGLPASRSSFAYQRAKVGHILFRSFVSGMTERHEEVGPMNERNYLAERFEENRTHLRAVAYRMLGSVTEVDDAVQEAWLRLSRADATGIDNLGGWLPTGGA